MPSSIIIILLAAALTSNSVNGEARGGAGDLFRLAAKHGPEVVDIVTTAISNLSPGPESPPTQQYRAVNNDYSHEEESKLPLLRNLNDGCWTICQFKGGQCDHCGKIGLCCRRK